MRRAVMVCLVAALAMPSAAAGQDEGPAGQTPRRADGPWFGIPLPPGPEPGPAVVVGPRAPRPVTFERDAASRELSAEALGVDLTTIVGFSKASRARREIGSGQLWGRVAGLPSADETVAWTAAQFRAAGIGDVRVQPVAQDERASLWLPLEWRVTVHGAAAFGPGTADVVLHSAIPVVPSDLPAGPVTAPLVWVGTGGDAVLRHLDVRGKIAVQLAVPQGHMLFERGSVIAQAQALFKAGAVAVLTVLRLPGNEPGRDFSNCGGPCFNVGGRDGWFLEAVLNDASRRPAVPPVTATLSLRTETRRGLVATNAVAVVPGRRTDEAIVVNAHADAWFDGAGDNADGLAVMLGLARHFAKPAHRPARTLVFVASAGHHTPGINGPRGFIAANPDLAAKTVLMLNVEHVAQRNFSPARTTHADGYRQAIADTGEAPVYAGVSTDTPFLHGLFQDGVTRYGVNFVSAPSTMGSGETGGYMALAAARITVMQAPPLYHTTGETLDVISAPGLERMARFLAYFLEGAAGAPRAALGSHSPPGR
ncbi:MAG: M28 family peptidase [Acidobacteria bacterium]|nr:M28 family peptidase [Acidobacteriota bacterium]